VIIPDINLLVYAHNGAASPHRVARTWWEDLMAKEQVIALPWMIVFGFIRVVTHPAVLEEPLRPVAATEIVESWLEQSNVQILEPGPRHLEIVRGFFETTGVGGNLTTDTHLAALAVEHQCELHSNDSDFGRFQGLRWHNPLI
jgi:toxin-antitoxin system PIN domain toxin